MAIMRLQEVCSPCSHAMRDLLTVRSAVTGSVTKRNPVILLLYGFFNIRNCNGEENLENFEV